jgi:hypothetical protein
LEVRLEDPRDLRDQTDPLLAVSYLGQVVRKSIKLIKIVKYVSIFYHLSKVSEERTLLDSVVVLS